LDKSDNKKVVLIIYHSQGGNTRKMAETITDGARKINGIDVVLKDASNASVDDILSCDAVVIGSPEYFGYMAGAVKDFFDRTYEDAREKTFRLPYFVFVCAGNDGRGAVSNIERIASGYKWKKVLESFRVTGEVTDEVLLKLDEMGQTIAAGVDAGIY
jgi:multimeric flavodoxin WrbA